MAGVGQGVTGEQEQTGDTALRIDTDVFATLTATAGDSGGDEPTIVSWFDCWRR